MSNAEATVFMNLDPFGKVMTEWASCYIGAGDQWEVFTSCNMKLTSVNTVWAPVARSTHTLNLLQTTIKLNIKSVIILSLETFCLVWAVFSPLSYINIVTFPFLYLLPSSLCQGFEPLTPVLVTAWRDSRHMLCSRKSTRSSRRWLTVTWLQNRGQYCYLQACDII